MAKVLSDLGTLYWDWQEKHADPRVANWIFMYSPIKTLVFCGAYIYFCKFLGPRFMRDRKPFKPGAILSIYNLLQMVFSAFFFLKTLQIYLTGYSFFCQPVDKNEDPYSVAKYVWLFYISKLVEFSDSIFFVLMKKNNHLSILHITHHSTMPISSWMGCKFAPGGHSIFIGFANSFVHIWMYLYYFLSSMGPQYRKYIWWKKYLTIIQLVQFILVFLHNFQLYFRTCDYPMFLINQFMAHSVLFFVLFFNFYLQCYTTPKRQKKESNGTLKSNQDELSEELRQELRKRIAFCMPLLD